MAIFSIRRAQIFLSIAACLCAGSNFTITWRLGTAARAADDISPWPIGLRQTQLGLVLPSGLTVQPRLPKKFLNQNLVPAAPRFNHNSDFPTINLPALSIVVRWLTRLFHAGFFHLINYELLDP